MELKFWNHNIIDLDSENDFQQDKDLSVLANAVDFLNIKLAKKLPHETNVLEVGCGVQSIFYDNILNKDNWAGIDVFEENENGVKTIATKIASVEHIPYQNNYFDYILSNQSIEHWREYGVDPVAGLTEIRRVSKKDGKIIINFPIHLHGDKIFVKGDFEKIDNCFVAAGLKIINKTAVINSSIPNYKGWNLCGFPDFYVRSLPNNEETSYVVEYEATPIENATPIIKDFKKDIPIKKRQNIFSLNAHHGLIYLAWKIFNKIKTKIR